MKEMTIIVICSYVLFFALGAAIASIMFMVATNDSTLALLASNTSPEQISPSDWIKEDQIRVYDNQIVIDLQGAAWSTFADTNSMDPLLDKDANGIEVKPKTPADVNVGDVIAYNYQDSVIIHRVIDKAEDSDGTYFTAKGDNNADADPTKVRFAQIEGVLVGILY